MFDVIKGCNGESNCFGRRKIATCGYYNVQCSLQIEELKKKVQIFQFMHRGCVEHQENLESQEIKGKRWVY